jgi:hypothetical protein
LKDHEALHFWEACVLAALASGRKTGPEAVEQADLLVKEQAKRRREIDAQRAPDREMPLRESGA